MKRYVRVPYLVGAFLLLALLGVCVFGVSLLSLGAAYTAKLLCSGVFVSGRTAESIRAEDLGAEDLRFLVFIPANVDGRGRTVVAGFAPYLAAKARYREGLGCSLDKGDDWEAKMPPLAALPTAVPGDSGLAVDSAFDPTRLNAALAWAFAEPDSVHLRRTRAVVVVHAGRIVAERYAPGFDRDMPLAGWSLAKAVSNALAGVLVKEGKLTLSDVVRAPEWDRPDDPRRSITVNQLLRMETGLDFSEEPGEPLQDVSYMLFLEVDAADFAADKPLRYPPGSHWAYASGTTNILGRLIRRTVGEDAYQTFPRRALFEPLEMKSAVLETDPSGTFVGSSFMYATARDWARLGQLYLNDGVWNGRRLLPEGWVGYTTTPAASAPRGRYGAHFWLKLQEEIDGLAEGPPLPADTFHAVGFEGQFISIVPSRQLVVVRLGLTRHPPAWLQTGFLNRILAAMR